MVVIAAKVAGEGGLGGSAVGVADAVAVAVAVANVPDDVTRMAETREVGCSRTSPDDQMRVLPPVDLRAVGLVRAMIYANRTTVVVFLLYITCVYLASTNKQKLTKDRR